LSSDEILNAWPGHDGNPLRDHALSAFRGREREMVKLRALLTEPGRPRSVIIFGDRRTGKTSFLMKLVREFPPKRDNVCAVFDDIAGLEIDARPGALPRALFKHIVDALDSNRNQEFRDALRSATGSEVSVTALARDL